MIHTDIFTFLSELKENNHKPWFDANNDRYKPIRASVVKFMEELLPLIQAFDAEIPSTDPSKTLFRINRDVRFSKDKSPYKTNFGAEYSKGGKKSGTPGYYIHFEPNGCFLACGAYAPSPEQLANIRKHIDLFGDELTIITEDTIFRNNWGEVRGERLKSAPKGYEKDHKHVHFLAMKNMYVMHKFEEERVFSPNFAEYVANTFETVYAFQQFLLKAVESSE